MNKLRRIAFFVLIFSNILYNTILYSNNNSYLDNCENFVNLCMSMWTKIDLIQAINATDLQKVATIEELVVDSSKVFLESENIKSFWALLSSFEIASILSLIESVQMVFKEVFCDIETQSFNQVILFLGKSINLLQSRC